MARAFSLTCTPAAIAEGSKCLECLDPDQLKALQIYFMDLFIAGAESSTPRTADELITLGKCFCEPFKIEVIRTYLLWILADMFYDATPSTIADLVEAVKCLKCSDNLTGIEAAILCDTVEAIYSLSAPV